MRCGPAVTLRAAAEVAALPGWGGPRCSPGPSCAYRPTAVPPEIDCDQQASDLAPHDGAVAGNGGCMTATGLWGAGDCGMMLSRGCRPGNPCCRLRAMAKRPH
ncbi:hypothetical protein NDU88_005431 [Pleurodeles waltl]|uniref:Uncharacterized protein n=1 Tax=Pleurodeles waltl TaxID=8319 RepID=A0AAV7PNL3_PLEWA|nr:hypothetical protein NDU88_005431 [Pleurodeles waltl]